MSDEFLYRLRESPRPEFVEALKARIFQEPEASRKPGESVTFIVGGERCAGLDSPYSWDCWR